jgi:hypothetical protein
VLLLPGLLTIAEIHITEGRVKKAEEYLNAAQWSFLKNNDKNQADKRREKGQMLSAEYFIDNLGSSWIIKSICTAASPNCTK